MDDLSRGFRGVPYQCESHIYDDVEIEEVIALAQVRGMELGFLLGCCAMAAVTVIGWLVWRAI